MPSKLHKTVLMLTAVAAMAALATPGRAWAQAQACNTAPADKITELVERWQAAIAAGDADAITGLYAEDAVLLPATSEAPRMGRAAIRAYFVELASRHPLPTITMRSVMTGCGMASEIGTARYQVTGQRKGTRMFVGGRYTMVFTERDGRWQIAQQSLSLDPQLNRRTALAR
jgi:uncharacterized protein (TIGR02246 family)